MAVNKQDWAASAARRAGPAFVAFVGDAFAVQGRVLKQVESLRRESEFVLRDMQAASGCFMADTPFPTNPPGKKSGISGAGQSDCRCEIPRMDAAEPDASGSNEIQAATVPLSRCAVASG